MLDSESVPRFQCFSRTEKAFVNHLWVAKVNNILCCHFLKGLTEEDLTNYQIQSNKSRAVVVRLERYYNWTDGLEAALCKHKSRQKFHEVALKRCMRSQKQIHKAFPKASRNQRKRAFNKFQNEHRGLRHILSKQKEGVSEFLSYQSPQKIGQDYIEGNARLQNTRPTKYLTWKAAPAVPQSCSSMLLSQSRSRRATHEYTSFFNPWTEASTRHTNITRSLIHEPKQANPWAKTSLDLSTHRLWDCGSTRFTHFI